jgi:DNA-binding LacI/PurR family transcriptional regulator
MSLLSSRTLDDQIGPLIRLPRCAQSRTIGLLSLDPSPYGKAAVLSGIQHAARESDYCVSIVSPLVTSQGSLRSAVRRLRHLAVDGILVLAPQPAAIETLARVSAPLPVVALGAPQQDVLSAVSSDHYAGAAAATRHLLGLGHRTVFHIAGALDGSEPGSRLAGWRDALLAAGTNVPAALVGDGSPQRGYALGCCLARRDDVTAIFVAGDQMALGVLRAMSEAGRRVPDDISVVGFGGIPEGEFFNPPLTTVRQDFTEMGRRGAELLQAEIEAGGLATVHETIPAELILRASTAAAV